MGGRWIGYVDTKKAPANMVMDLRTLEVGEVVYLTMWDRAQPLDDHDVNDAFIFPAKVTGKEQTGMQRSGSYHREDWRIDFDEIEKSLSITVEDGEFRDRIPAAFRTPEDAAVYVRGAYESNLKYLTEEFEEWRKKVEHRQASLARPVNVWYGWNGEDY